MAPFDLVPGGSGRNYTGIFTKSIVFTAALVLFLAATGLTLAAIVTPNWISFENHTSHDTHIHYTYGLHRRCSNINVHPNPLSASSSVTTSVHMKCVPFPDSADCQGEDGYFCRMWRSVGFLMSLGVVLEGMTIAAFLIIILGGKQRREQGWSILSLLVAITALAQAFSMSLMTYLFDNDSHFFAGWFLDKSWIMCTVSWSIQALCAITITTAALTLPTEGGYELIPNQP